MVRRALKNAIFYIAVLININCADAQDSPPIFIGGKDSISQLNINLLYKEISYSPQGFMTELQKETGLCYSGIGLFKFIIKKNGDVEIISFVGKLPQKLIDKVKGNIKSTKGLWISEIKNDKVVDSYPFLYFVSLDINLSDCPISELTNQINGFDIVHELSTVLGMYQSKDSFLVTQNGYILPVMKMSSIR